MEFKVKSFGELDVHELYGVLKLRSEIFVIEQQCIYQDMDDKDQKGFHVLGTLNGKLIAYARILPAGVSYKEISIGRVVVDKNYRGKDCGKQLMKACIHTCTQLFKAPEIVISAQYYLLKFYRELGFIEEGEIYPEDDIPHIKMRF